MSEIYQKLESICGSKNVSKNLLDILAYNSDLGSLPPAILKLYDMKQGEYIVRPEKTSQLIKIFEFANKNKIPITPRAGASAGIGGVLPVNGGIILDITSLDKIISFDPINSTVTVEPGVSWKKLIKFLRKYKRKIGIHPSSSPSATIGGFISTGGYAGIGAPKYGPISQQIVNMEVLLPTGELLNLTPPLTSVFVGNEGTLGIITKIALKTYPLQGICAIAFGFKNIRIAIQNILKLLKTGIKPYHLMVFDKYFASQSRRVGHDFPNHNIIVFIAISGDVNVLTVQEEMLQKVLSDGVPLSGECAFDEWDRRYNAELFVKKAGPSLILLEIGFSLIDVPQFVSNCKELVEEKGFNIGFIGVLGHGNTMLCMPFLLADERKGVEYIKLLSISRKIVSSGLELGGTLYGVGLHNTPYLKYIYSSETLRLFKKLKDTVDPNNILNPGKIIENRVPDQLVFPPKQKR
ncbi:MAG: FAD-binding oxidoreductase [Candidatus Helarchaeota archaeon]